MHDDSAMQAAMDAYCPTGRVPASNNRRTLTLILLGAVFAVHFLDRQILAILIQPIKEPHGARSAFGLCGLGFPDRTRSRTAER